VDVVKLAKQSARKIGNPESFGLGMLDTKEGVVSNTA
jgi:hypothetical protein